MRISSRIPVKYSTPRKLLPPMLNCPDELINEPVAAPLATWIPLRNTCIVDPFQVAATCVQVLAARRLPPETTGEVPVLSRIPGSRAGVVLTHERPCSA